MDEGKLIIVSAPSGSGKTTLVKHLLKTIPKLDFSVSCTTREPRQKEKQGQEYYFLCLEDFKNKIQQEEFVEWEEVYTDVFYGTLQAELERIWKQGKHVIFDIDVKGALNIKHKFGERAKSIFIKAPCLETIEDRLRARNTESEEKLQIRLAKLKEEYAYADRFDTIILNDELWQAKKDIETSVKVFIN